MLSRTSLNELEAPMLENEEVPGMLEEWKKKKEASDWANELCFKWGQFGGYGLPTIGFYEFIISGNSMPLFQGVAGGFGAVLLTGAYSCYENKHFNKIDRQIPYSVKLFPRIVLVEKSPSSEEETWKWWSSQSKLYKQKKNLAEKDYFESAKLINAVRNWATNWDLYHETGDEKYKVLAEKESSYLKENCGKRFGTNFVDDTSGLEAELLEFFPYEKELWSSVQSGTAPSEADVRKYVDMRGADGRYHAKIIEGFTGKDFSGPLHTWMRLADLDNDLYQLGSDMEAGKPNVAVMYTAQRMRPERITAQDIRELGYANAKISSLKDSLMADVSGFNYGKSGFLNGELQELYHPTPEYVPIR